MNNVNNEAEAWVCESEGAKELFAQTVPADECSEELMCSWCSLKSTYRFRCGPNFGGICTLEAPCKYCMMDQKEWENFVSAKLEERDAEVKAATAGYLADGIARLNYMKCQGLDAHNNSIDLCISTFTDIFNMGTDKYHWVMEKQHFLGDLEFNDAPFVPTVYSGASIIAYDGASDWVEEDTRNTSIELRGKESGIKYKISITFRPKRARLLARRQEEILLANSEYPISDCVLRGFVKASDFMEFRVQREDHDGKWDYMCIDPEGVFGVWPGDDIATLMMCLHDDLNTALDPKMYTLRNGLGDASKVAFMHGNSKSSIHRLMAYECAYDRIVDLSKSMNSAEIYSVVYKMKQNFSDPEFGNDPSSEVDYSMLQEEAWEGEWNE